VDNVNPGSPAHELVDVPRGTAEIASSPSGARGRYKLRSSAWLALVRRWGLLAWFTVVTVQYLAARTTYATGFLPGSDARIYYRAAEAWVTGGNPWTAGVGGVAFGAPPPSLLLPALFLPLGEVLMAIVWVVAGVGLAFWTLRRLGLPAWWILFPPLFQSVWLGNASVLVIALLVLGGSAPAAIATLTKLYAVVPALVLGQWRVVAACAGALIVTAPLLPWQAYLELGPTSVVSAQNLGYSAAAVPLLIPPVLLALWMLGRDRAAWLAVPALWPFSQVTYGVMALPAMSATLAVFMSVSHPLAVPIGIIVAALVTRLLDPVDRQPVLLEARGEQRALVGDDHVLVVR
jgi:hypothetical protein